MTASRLRRKDDIISALTAAQRIAFAPFIFQATVCAQRCGLFACILEHEAGLTEAAIAQHTQLSAYAVSVLVDVLIAADVLEQHDGRIQLTKTGQCLALDSMTVVNINFTADVCYRGLEHLAQALRSGKPEGLQELGPWQTIYPALAELPEPARTSWFAFDHYYSDRYFDALARQIAEDFNPKVLLDIGGNTGKFAAACLT